MPTAQCDEDGCLMFDGDLIVLEWQSGMHLSIDVDALVFDKHGGSIDADGQFFVVDGQLRATGDGHVKANFGNDFLRGSMYVGRSVKEMKPLTSRKT